MLARLGLFGVDKRLAAGQVLLFAVLVGLDHEIDAVVQEEVALPAFLVAGVELHELVEHVGVEALADHPLGPAHELLHRHQQLAALVGRVYAAGLDLLAHLVHARNRLDQLFRRVVVRHVLEHEVAVVFLVDHEDARHLDAAEVPFRRLVLVPVHEFGNVLALAGRLERGRLHRLFDVLAGPVPALAVDEPDARSGDGGERHRHHRRRDQELPGHGRHHFTTLRPPQPALAASPLAFSCGLRLRTAAPASHISWLWRSLSFSSIFSL